MMKKIIATTTIAVDVEPSAMDAPVLPAKIRKYGKCHPLSAYFSWVYARGGCEWVEKWI